MAAFGVPLNELEASQCLKYFDANRDGKLSFNEFLGAVRGELSAARRDVVHQAFSRADPHMSGAATLRQLETAYCPASPADLDAFLSAWGTDDKNAQISLEQFESFYADLSASEKSDEVFIANMRVAWRL